jgi:hypothetical protein
MAARKNLPKLSPEEIEELRRVMEFKQARMKLIRTAYMRRTDFEGKVPEFEHVREAAQDFIRANYTYQEALFGKIRVKLSAAKLLR